MKAWPLLAATALIFGTLYAIGRSSDGGRTSASPAGKGPSVSEGYYPEPSKNGFTPAPTQDQRTPTVVPGSMASMLADVVMRDLSIEKAGFGSVMVIGFTVRNGTDLAIKDLLVECSVFGNSGTQIGKVSTRAYERIDPKRERRIRELNMGLINNQAASADCRIAHFERA